MQFATRRIHLLLLTLLLIAGCTTPIQRAEQLAAQDEWIKAVIEYRQALRNKPGDIELKSRLQQTELKAADYYYQQGMLLLELDNLDGAIVQFQQGLVAMPQHSKVRQAMQDTLARKEADELVIEAVRNMELGKDRDALDLLNRALEVYPEHQAAGLLLKQHEDSIKKTDESALVLASREPITLNFKQTELKTAFDFIVSAFSINVIFDEAVKNVPVTLYASDVTFEQALNLMLRITQTFYKRIGRNTILIAPDTADKRGQYEDHIIRTYHLKSIPAKNMSDILKNMLGLKKLVINEELNSLIIRDTQEMLQLSEKLIATNDRKPAELILDVEILEVNRTKAEQLGLDFGSQVSIAYDRFVGSFRDALAAGTVTLPGVTFRYFKQDVDAKTLANPKIRVMSNRKANIHIGDRVPLRSSTIQDATGQTRTTFEYRDIGIRLQVEPEIHLDNSVTVQLNLEVSSLGQNLGTTQEPAFSIGTRNATTIMLLKDGETAILGGLIRDEDRKTRVRVPGLGDIPLIGALFTSYDDSATRTDVLLTITPRIVRTWAVPPRQQRHIYSGTEKQYSTSRLFAFLDDPADTPDSASIRLGDAPSTAVAAAGIPRQPVSPAPPALSMGEPPPSLVMPGEGVAATTQGILSFDQPLYNINSGQEVTVSIVAENIADISNMPLELLFNPNLLEFVRVDKGNISGNLQVVQEANKGVVRLELTDVSGLAQRTVLAQLTLKASREGISYLIYKAPNYTTMGGESQRANIRASRIVIR